MVNFKVRRSTTKSRLIFKGLTTYLLINAQGLSIWKLRIVSWVPKLHNNYLNKTKKAARGNFLSRPKTKSFKILFRTTMSILNNFMIRNQKRTCKFIRRAKHYKLSKKYIPTNSIKKVINYNNNRITFSKWKMKWNIKNPINLAKISNKVSWKLKTPTKLLHSPLPNRLWNLFLAGPPLDTNIHFDILSII